MHAGLYIRYWFFLFSFFLGSPLRGFGFIYGIPCGRVCSGAQTLFSAAVTEAGLLLFACLSRLLGVFILAQLGSVRWLDLVAGRF